MVGVVGDEADPVAGQDAEADEGVRQAMGSLAELAVRELLVAVDHPDLVAEELDGPVAEVEHRQRHEHRNASSSDPLAYARSLRTSPARPIDSIERSIVLPKVKPVNPAAM